MGDLLSLETRLAIVEINLKAIDALTVDSPSAAGRANRREAESFAARLAMLRMARERIEIITRGAAWSREGTVDAIAIDHALLNTSTGVIHVPIEAIACAVRPSDRERTL